MRNALTTLPWVEPDTIQTDATRLQVKFTIKSGEQFNLEEAKQALTPRYADGVKVLTGPTTDTPPGGTQATGKGGP